MTHLAAKNEHGPFALFRSIVITIKVMVVMMVVVIVMMMVVMMIPSGWSYEDPWRPVPSMMVVMVVMMMIIKLGQFNLAISRRRRSCVDGLKKRQRVRNRL